MCPSNLAEKGANTRLGMPLKDRYACGTPPDRFTRANECIAEPAAAAEGDVHTGASTAVACSTNASPGALLEGRYASRTTPNGFVKVKKCAAEGETCAGETIVGVYTARAGIVAQASIFAVMETASGFACVPDLFPLAYRSMYFQDRLPLTGPMRSVLMFPPPTKLCLCFGAFPFPMHSAISAQVFQFGLKTSLLGKAQGPFAKAITVLRLYLITYSTELLT